MTQTPNLPPLIESEETDYRDSGVVSSVAIAGHPLHPLIVTFPIAFLSSAPLADIAFGLTQDPFWSQAALWLIGAGFITSLVAAATGMMDFLKVERVRKRSAGWAHMILNVTSMMLTAINWALRWGNPSGAVYPTGIILSSLVAILLGLSGWYGAELIYRHKVAVIGYGDRDR